MEHRSSLSLSQNPATFPYPEPDRCPHFDFLKSHINIILPSTPGSSELSLSLRFPYQNPVYLLPMRATWPTHLILLYFITRTIFGEEYRSVSFSLCSFLHSPVASSPLTQIFSSTPNSQTTAAYVPPSMWATKFHTHTKQQAKL